MPTPVLSLEDEPLYLAAERVTSGIYEEIESLRRVIIQEEGFLPASLNGRVACYHRIRPLPAAQRPTDTAAPLLETAVAGKG